MKREISNVDLSTSRHVMAISNITCITQALLELSLEPFLSECKTMTLTIKLHPVWCNTITELERFRQTYMLKQIQRFSCFRFKPTHLLKKKKKKRFKPTHAVTKGEEGVNTNLVKKFDDKVGWFEDRQVVGLAGVFCLWMNPLLMFCPWGLCLCLERSFFLFLGKYSSICNLLLGMRREKPNL